MLFLDTQNETIFPSMTGSTILDVVIILSIWFASGILLALWVRKDIHKHELVGTNYLIIVGLTSIVGLVFYMIVRYNAKCALAEDEAACIVEELKKEEP